MCGARTSWSIPRYVFYLCDNAIDAMPAQVPAKRDLDEVEALSLRAHFIAEELGLQSVKVVLGESPEDETGRAGGSLPLAPAIVYA